MAVQKTRQTIGRLGGIAEKLWHVCGVLSLSSYDSPRAETRERVFSFLMGRVVRFAGGRAAGCLWLAGAWGRGEPAGWCGSVHNKLGMVASPRRCRV